jgi:hypothetical protein
MLGTPAQLLQLLARWPVRTQQHARRNALVASTALAERRRERSEVEDFLTRHAATRAAEHAAARHA